MNYPFENLGPEKFQEFSQSLLEKSFPDLQCFSVGQPDGGRDIVSYTLGKSSKEFTVYQVKYVRSPGAEKDLHKWLLKILKDEAPKVKRLISTGAKQFFLITNISGTAHFESGSIDQMNQILEDELGIPSRCWWREEINRKLDNAKDLKWVYPELMTGPDLIRSIIESGLTEDKERRSSALRAFIVDQFDSDQVVKFKQVDLQNRLLDLFIDVPISPPQSAETDKTLKNYLRNYEKIAYSSAQILKSDSASSESLFDEQLVQLNLNFNGYRSESKVGSATLLLNKITQKETPWIVLEGAPGQGKSTITQYVCQVHRMRLLGEGEVKKILPDSYKESESIEVIPKNQIASSICLPIRVDLRDLAVWLSNINPFSSEKKNIEIPGEAKSLEEFLAFLIQHYSGGLKFSTSDLAAIFRESPVLLVFDGLDEVAEIEKRREVVNSIHKGCRRLKGYALSLQVIVTSRPAAFANSPGLPESDFPRYHLDSLNKPLIDEYANKWMNAKRLPQRDRSEVKLILRDKLDQPHLKDLAKNPMQLTILLSLIYNRGASLPDKRTALYDSYVDLFFSRESEKTPVVKKYRDLLLDIHKYIAWALHSEAEQRSTNGSITQNDLQLSIRKYLEWQGYNIEIAQELVAGALERIVALVSRVEGTYEFEVQPLREYFAARYLYETARHSSPGKEDSGTKPDRFDAIARNFYWLNVTRFYAGCYDKGELPSLIDRLEDLINSEGYKLISHPRTLAATLLSDWVFSQHPRSVANVTRLILDDIGLRYVLPSSSRRVGQSEPMILPPECGRSELIKHCFSLLEKNIPLDFALDIIDLIVANTSSSHETFDLWLSGMSSYDNKQKIKWLEYGLHLGIIPQPLKLTLIQLENLFADLPTDATMLELLYRARRFDYIESKEERFQNVLNMILDSVCDINRRFFNRRGNNSILEMFNDAVNPTLYAIAFREPRPAPLAYVVKSYLHSDDWSLLDDKPVPSYDESHPCFQTISKCLEIIELVKCKINLDAQLWATSIEPWNEIVEMIRQYWGDIWLSYSIANIASGIKSSIETYSDHSDLLNSDLDLCKRVRYARLRAGQPSWWIKQLSQCTDEKDIALALLVMFTWASPKALKSNLDKVDELLKGLQDEAWKNIFESVDRGIFLRQSSSQKLTLDISRLSDLLSPRTIVLLSLRTGKSTRNSLYLKYLNEYDGTDTLILKFCFKVSLDFLEEDYANWNQVKDVIQRIYLKGFAFEAYTFHRLSREMARRKMPSSIAVEIASNASSYPGFLVAMAEARVKDEVASKVIPVGDIAEKDNWFDS